MKRFFTLLTMTILVIFSANTPIATTTVEAAWVLSTEEEEYFYDLNNDEVVNVIDFLIVKQEVLSGTLTIRDLINIQKYLLSDENIRIDFSEEDMNVCSDELDSKYLDIFSGYLTEYKYDNGELRLRYLKDCNVYELRCHRFGHGNLLSSISTNNDNIICDIVRENDGYYAIDSSFLNNATEITDVDFDETDIVFIEDNEDSTTFFLSGTDYPEKISFPTTKKAMNLLSFKYFIENKKVYPLVQDTDGVIYCYTNSFSMWNLCDLPSNKPSDELLEKYFKAFDGEFISYNSINKYLTVQLEDGCTTFAKISPELKETSITLNEWKIGDEIFSLGITEDGEIRFDVNSRFAVG